MCDLEIEVDDPVERWRRGMEALGVLRLPTLASIQHLAEDSEAVPTDTAVIYLEAVVSTVLDTSADGVDSESAGRCLMAEDVLLILTGSNDIDHVRTWMRTRGLQRLEPGS